MTDVILEKQAVTERRPEDMKQEAPSFKWNGPRTAEGRQRIAQAQLKHGAISKEGFGSSFNLRSEDEIQSTQCLCRAGGQRHLKSHLV